VERATLYKMTPRPTCNRFVEYMLRWGLNVDVEISTIMRDMALSEVGGNGIGPYNGRVNQNELRKGSSLRLVLGKAKNTYRLINLL
jgi:hypothetical protein